MLWALDVVGAGVVGARVPPTGDAVAPERGEHYNGRATASALDADRLARCRRLIDVAAVQLTVDPVTVSQGDDRPHRRRRIVLLDAPASGQRRDDREAATAGVGCTWLGDRRSGRRAPVGDGDLDAVLADAPGDRQLAVIEGARVPNRVAEKLGRDKRDLFAHRLRQDARSSRRTARTYPTLAGVGNTRKELTARTFPAKQGQNLPHSPPPAIERWSSTVALATAEDQRSPGTAVC